jgi:hypothetical protein
LDIKSSTSNLENNNSKPRLYVVNDRNGTKYGIYDKIGKQIHLVWGSVGTPVFVRGCHWTITVNFLLQKDQIEDVVEILAEYAENLEDEILQEDLKFIINFLVKVST